MNKIKLLIISVGLSLLIGCSNNSNETKATNTLNSTQAVNPTTQPTPDVPLNEHENSKKDLLLHRLNQHQ